MIERRILTPISMGEWWVIISEAIPRNPDSSATEKDDLSALKDAESTKGPESESSIGRVFIAKDCERWVVWRGVVR